MAIDFADLLMEVVKRRASDLHLTAGVPPTVRQRGRLSPLDDYPVLTPEDTREFIYSILTTEQRRRLETDLQLDFAYSSRATPASASTPTSSAARSPPRSA